MGWKLAYHHDHEGQPKAGSIKALTDGIINGRQVRVVLVSGGIKTPVYWAYQLATVRCGRDDKGHDIVTGLLALRPSADDLGNLLDPIQIGVATVCTNGKYVWGSGLGSRVQPAIGQEMKWFIDD